MKKVFVTLALIGAVMAGNAQITKGKFFINGSLGFTSTSSSRETAAGKNDQPGHTMLDFSPKAGYYITDNIAVGLGLVYTMETDNKLNGSNTAPGVTTERSTATLNIAPYLRYSMPMTEKFGFFMDLLVPIGSVTRSEKVTSGTAPSDIKGSSFGVSLTPGVQWFVKDNLSLEATLGGLKYSSSVVDASSSGATDKTTTSSFGLTFGTAASFGISFYFGGK